LYAGVPPVDDRPVTTPRGRQTARRNRTPYAQRRSPFRARNRRDRWDQSFDDSPVRQYADPPPVLDALSAEYRETVHLGVLDGPQVLHVDKIDSLERVGVASKIGSRGPALTASFGKALLAASSDFAISLTGPAARFALERVIAVGPRLVEIARQLSIRLGWEPENGTMRH
jgi:hypothetical protein